MPHHREECSLKVVVIGSGMSGLTAAAYLARSSHQVTLFEQFDQPGGVTTTFRQSGFGWDLGPLLLEGFEPGGRGAQVLSELGISGQVQLFPGERGYHFPDFEFWPPEGFTTPHWRQQRLETLFPREKTGIQRYYRFYRRTMQTLSLSRRIKEQTFLSSLPQRLLWLNAYLPLHRYRNWDAERLMRHFFHDPRLRAVFTSILADFSISPDQFPALGVPPLNSEASFDSRLTRQSTNGGFPSHAFVHGGIRCLSRAVQDAFQKAGGKLVTSARVTKIIVEDFQVKGVRLEDGSLQDADVVIASGGAQETFFDLLGENYLPAQLARQARELPRMESVLMVHVGLNFDPRPYQRGPLCYYFQHYDVQAAIEDCRRGIYKPGADGFRIYIPSMHSPQLAPEGCFAVTIYAAAPNQLLDGDWDAQRTALADELLKRAERFIPGLRARAVTSAIFTPADFRRRLNLQHHAYAGVAPQIGVSGIPHHTPVRGLWFIGAQSESGGGIPAVMSGARRVAHAVLHSG
jgi:prolycopene isomerase